MSRNRCRMVIAVLFVAYAASYLVVTRRAFAEADRYKMYGYYFVLPTNASSRWVNQFCRCFYYPCICVESLLGTGREPACDPMEGLSSADGRRSVTSSP